MLYVAGWQIFGTSRSQAWDWSSQALEEIAKAAEDRRVVIAIEPTPTDSNLVESCDDAIELMEQVGAKNVRLMFDTQHAYYRNEVPTDYVYRMGKNLRHLHLSNLAGCSGHGSRRLRRIGVCVEGNWLRRYLAMEIDSTAGTSSRTRGASSASNI